MKTFSAFVVATVLGVSSFSANALEITIDNQTTSKVAMAFSYLPSNDKDWVVDGWYNVDANEKALLNLDTSNEMYYVYAEFSNGKKIEGGEGAVKLMVQNRSFVYKQNAAPDSNVREVSFLRARSNGDKATIKIK